MNIDEWIGHELVELTDCLIIDGATPAEARVEARRLFAQLLYDAAVWDVHAVVGAIQLARQPYDCPNEGGHNNDSSD